MRAVRESEIVVNGRFLAKPMGGVTRVGRELLRALVAELQARGGPRIRIAAPAGAALDELGLDGEIVRATKGYASNLGEQVALPLHYPQATILSFCNATPLLARRSVVWIHDTHVFDAPESYTPAFRAWYRALLTGVIARKFEVVTVSAFSRGRLIAQGVPEDRVTLIYNGGDHLLRTPPDDAILAHAAPRGEPFVLVMGSPAKLKNLDFALRALSPALDPSIRIAVVGLHQQGPYAPGHALARDGRIAILPMVSDGELRALYAHARAVIVPSLLEGFGLFAAEALFEGAPLVLSDRGSHPEVGGEAALYFDPTSETALVAAVRQALDDATSQRLRAAAVAQREKFRWRLAAQSTIERFL